MVNKSLAIPRTILITESESGIVLNRMNGVVLSESEKTGSYIFTFVDCESYAQKVGWSSVK